MLFRKLMATAACSAALLAGSAGVAATTASAAIAQPPASLVCISHPLPIHAGILGITSCNGKTLIVRCRSLAAALHQKPLAVANGCATQVRLFASPAPVGASRCVSPRTSTGMLRATYRSFKITTRRGRC